jgi:hypothetical protein
MTFMPPYESLANVFYLCQDRKPRWIPAMKNVFVFLIRQYQVG